MVWSNWKGAVLLLLAGAGLAWSQVPTSRHMPAGSMPAGDRAAGERGATERAATERIMTVHENGKALRCRVITNWRTQDGKLAYQLQVIETGEMLTIAEDGPPTMVASNQSSVRAMPMRIFRWGKSQTPPAGVPVPPQGVTTNSATANAATANGAAANAATTNATTTNATAAKAAVPSSNNNASSNVTGTSGKVVTASNTVVTPSKNVAAPADGMSHNNGTLPSSV